MGLEGIIKRLFRGCVPEEVVCIEVAGGKIIGDEGGRVNMEAEGKRS